MLAEKFGVLLIHDWIVVHGPQVDRRLQNVFHRTASFFQDVLHVDQTLSSLLDDAVRDELSSLWNDADVATCEHEIGSGTDHETLRIWSDGGRSLVAVDSSEGLSEAESHERVGSSDERLHGEIYQRFLQHG